VSLSYQNSLVAESSQGSYLRCMIESPIDALKKAANLNGEKFQSLSDFKRLSLNKSIDNNGK